MAEVQFTSPSTGSANETDIPSPQSVAAPYQSYQQNLPPVTPVGAAPAPKPKGFLEKLADVIQAPLKAVAQPFADAAENSADEMGSAISGQENPLAAAGATASNFAGPILRTANRIATPITWANQELQKGTGAVVDILTGSPQGSSDQANQEMQQGGMDQINAWAAKHPDAAKELKGLYDTAQVGMLAGGSEEAFDAVPDVANAVKAKMAMTPEDIHAAALADATPSAQSVMGSGSNGLLRDADGELTTTPKMNEAKGIFGKRTPNPTVLNQDAAAALEKSPAYQAATRAGGTALEKSNAIQPELVQMNKDLLGKLNEEKTQISPNDVEKQVTKAVTNVPNENPAMSPGDVTSKNYVRVFTNVVNKWFRPDMDDPEAAAATKDLSPAAKVLKVKQTMDTYYKNARGATGAFPGANASDPAIRSLDVVNTAARDALTKILVDNVKSTDVKANLKSEWDLHRGADELWQKAQDEKPTVIGRFAQRHAIIGGAGRFVFRRLGGYALRGLFSK